MLPLLHGVVLENTLKNLHVLKYQISESVSQRTQPVSVNDWDNIFNMLNMLKLNNIIKKSGTATVENSMEIPYKIKHRVII